MKPKLFNSEYQKEQSEKYRYQHIHTGEYCTFEAWVAEHIVLRRAEKLKLGRPSYKFWTKGDPNHWLWMKQLNATRALFELYSEEAVMAAIKSKEFNKYLLIGLQNGRGWKINPAFEYIVTKFFLKLESEKKNIKEMETLEVAKVPVTRTKRLKKKNILNKLRGSDGG